MWLVWCVGHIEMVTMRMVVIGHYVKVQDARFGGSYGVWVAIGIDIGCKYMYIHYTKLLSD